MALSEYDAAAASPSSSTRSVAATPSVEDHGDPSRLETPLARPSRRRRIARRLGVALVLGASLSVVAGALPATAYFPVGTRLAHVSQWSHRGHRAIDIAGPRGTRIVPIASGRVVFAGWRSNCGGYQVWVDHRNGLYSAYYHMSREVSYRGEWVSGGTETIGYVGATGCATGPHLHVEVWHGFPWSAGSYRVNPWHYIDNGRYLPSRYR